MKILLQIRSVIYAPVILLSSVVAQAQSVQPITVTDADTSQPVACYVNGLSPDGKSLNLGKTDPPGQFKFTGDCVAEYGLQFIPEDGSIYYEKLVLCKDALANGVRLKRIPMPESVKLKTAISKEVKSDPGSSAFVSNLLAAEVSSKAEARSYKITTLVQWGKFLKVDKPIVYEGVDRFEPSQDLVKATKAFQGVKGLVVTGAIDSKTLESAADPAKLEQFFKKQ